MTFIILKEQKKSFYVKIFFFKKSKNEKAKAKMFS